MSDIPQQVCPCETSSCCLADNQCSTCPCDPCECEDCECSDCDCDCETSSCTSEEVTDTSEDDDFPEDNDDERSCILRGKWMYDGSKTIDEMIAALQREITLLTDLKNDGWDLEHEVQDDYAYLVKVEAAN